jgi:nitrate reductase cytochrome c-type subunit
MRHLRLHVLRVAGIARDKCCVLGAVVLVSLSAVCLAQANPGSAGGSDTPQTPSQRQQRPRRLYFGAPPTIPHEAGAEMNECLACHGDSDSGAPLTPHPTRLRCRQCHVPADDKAGEFRQNNFSGLTVPGPATRIYPTAPPQMAHPVLLHENCLACHAPGARTDVVSTPHPQRLRCRQCHLSVATQLP